MTNIF